MTIKNSAGSAAPAIDQKPAQLFATASQFEDSAAAAAAQGALILCATGRWARRLLHRCRLQRQAGAAPGWPTPSIYWLRGWVRQTYAALWLPRRPLTLAWAYKLWHDAAQELAPPPGLLLQPALYHQMHIALEAMLEQGLEPGPSSSGHPLADFRRAVSCRFLELTQQHQLVLWHDMVHSLGQAIRAGQVNLPSRIIWTLAADPTPLEAELLTACCGASSTELWRIGAAPDQLASIKLYATPEQECRAVGAAVLQAWNAGQKNIGIVFADRDYLAPLKQCLEELAGQERPDFAKAIRYNLALGAPLAEHPLYQTATGPLRMLADPLPAPGLAAWLTSPYLKPADDQAIALLRSALWQKRQALTLMQALETLTQHFSLLALRRLAALQYAPLSQWLDANNACLAEQEFARFAGQHRATDALAQQHFKDIANSLKEAAGAITMNGTQALAWLDTLAQHIIISEKTPEITGIQLLSLAEAEGLAFESIWGLGFHGQALPPAAREWPLLDPEETRRMADSTPELQWKQGQRLLASLQAAAPRLQLSRAAISEDEAPFLACPLLPDECAANGQPIQATFDLWTTSSAEWARARWLREGRRTLLKPRPSCHVVAEPAAEPLASAWSVTVLEDLAACPFKFFCRHMLKLEPLTQPAFGIDPRQRGQILHRILKRFMDGLTAQAPRWPVDELAAGAWLKQAVQQELDRQPDTVFWRAERLRLIGDEQRPGLLLVWLGQERQWALQGWSVLGTEVNFNDLNLAELVLRGRVDRIDQHAQLGFMIWDYKSGNLPTAQRIIEQQAELQLPAYLLALKSDLLPDIKFAKQPLQAGYIALKKAADVKLTPLTHKGQIINWAGLFSEWTAKLKARLASPQSGHFKADPNPPPSFFRATNSACEFCDFFNLCGYFDQRPMPLGASLAAPELSTT